MNLLQIENRAAKVRLDDIVTKGLIDPLIDKIATLYGDDAVRNEWTSGEIVAVATDALETLEIEIDSVGGSVAEGYRLYKTLLALRERGVKVTANITKTAASMGSVIAMGADNVRMVDGGTFMIHDAQASIQGDSDRLRQVSNDLESVSDELAGIYAAKTGQDKDAIRSCMRQELFMNAATALRYGFVDEVYESPKKEYNPSILERMIGNVAKNPLANNANLLQKQPTNIMSLLDKLRHDPDLKAKLELAESDTATLTAELEEAKTLVTNAAEEITGLQADLEVSKTELTEISAKLEAETKALAEIKDLLATEQAKTTPEAINKLVTAQLATAGHPPIEDIPNQSASGKSKYEEYRNLQETNPRAASAFWEKHADDIKSGN